MKKLICLLLLSLTLLSITGCSNVTLIDNNSSSKNSANESSDSSSQSTTKSPDGIDVDLTQLSSTMVYSEVYNMMFTPDDYIGKKIKIQGKFAVYYDEEKEKNYFACVISDATACCSQGLEFVVKDDLKYPDDYPEPDTEITVVGTFDSYKENNSYYCQLLDAEMSY